MFKIHCLLFYVGALLGSVVGISAAIVGCVSPALVLWNLTLGWVTRYFTKQSDVDTAFWGFVSRYLGIYGD